LKKRVSELEEQVEDLAYELFPKVTAEKGVQNSVRGNRSDRRGRPPPFVSNATNFETSFGRGKSVGTDYDEIDRAASVKLALLNKEIESLKNEREQNVMKYFIEDAPSMIKSRSSSVLHEGVRH
jgi:hypothetical protein